jgi:hypothetical protein
VLSRRHELFASTACTFPKHVILIVFVSALRCDWRSPAHLLEGLGPHASDPGWPKWLPQAPFKATTNNSMYRRNWRSPGAPTTSKCEFYLDGVHIFKKRLFLMMFVKTQPYLVIRVRPAPSFDQYGLLASTVCTFLRRLMLIVFGCFFSNCAHLQQEVPFGSPGLSP